MKRNSLNRQILALAIPAIIANITTPLLSLVDIAIVGRLGSPAYVGAVAVGGTLFSMLYWLFSFLRFGTSGLTAQSLGEGNDEKLRLTLLRSLMIAAIASLLLILLHRPRSAAISANFFIIGSVYISFSAGFNIFTLLSFQIHLYKTVINKCLS